MKINLIPSDGLRPITVSNVITVVGRNSDFCDLIISHDRISAVHCVIAKSEGNLFVRDMGSTNGTFVNNTKVLRSAVLPGDELAFAEFKFRVEIDRGEEYQARDEAREITTYIPRPASGDKKKSDPNQSTIQVYDSFIGKVDIE